MSEAEVGDISTQGKQPHGGPVVVCRLSCWRHWLLAVVFDILLRNSSDNGDGASHEITRRVALTLTLATAASPSSALRNERVVRFACGSRSRRQLTSLLPVL